jgi:PAS domain S-box-containing protein
LNHKATNEAVIKNTSPPAAENIADNPEKVIDFGNIIDYLPQGVRIIDTHCIVKYINPAFEKLSLAKAADAVGKKCYDVYPSPFCRTPQCRLVKILNGEEPVRAEIERVGPGGSIIPCAVDAFPLYDEKQQLIGIMESFRDITQRKTLEGQVKEAEDRYKAIVELSGEVGEGIIMLEDIGGKEGVIVFASAQCSQTTGYSNKELLGKRLFDLVHISERAQALERHRRKIQGESLPGLYEITIISKNGSLVPVELTSAVTQYKGNPANVVFLRDISQRKKLEGQLALERDKANSYLDIAGVMIIALDLQCRITLINQEGCRILGYETGDLIGRSILETCLPPEYKDETQLVLKMILSGKQNLVEYHENPVVAKNGDIKIIAWRNTVIKDGDGKIIGILSSGHDITSLREAEKDLLKYQQSLEELVEKRTQALEQEIKQRIDFTRALVHELKTPLTAILSSSEVLVKELAGNPLLPAANNIYKSGVNLDRRITDLLDLAKSEVNVLSVNRRLIYPAKLLKDVKKRITPEIEKKNQQLITDIPATLSPILGDKDRLQQVLFNLLVNAIKYNRQNGKVFLKAFENETDIIFEVTDEGTGISENEQKRLFNPYYRIESDRERFDGLGLGLALSKSLVEMHGGYIWINSQKGKGSTFTFSVPKIKRKSMQL